MQTIDLECPGCKTHLELDAGFAGGVCRCFSCGTLMTVPADPKRERAEKLSRPARPDAPGGGRPSAPAPGKPAAAPAKPAAPAAPAPGSATRRPAAPPPATPATPPPAGKAAKPASPVPAEENVAPSASRPSAAAAAGAASAAMAAGAVETFVTASGKVVTITAKVIPTARRRRKLVRASAVIIYVVVVGAIAAACIAAIVMLARSPGPNNGDNPAGPDVKTADRFDPEANPFENKGPNVLGIPLVGRSVAAVIDGGGESSQWLSVVFDTALAGLRKSEPGQAFQVVLWQDEAALAFPDNPQHFAPGDRAALRNFFYAHVPAGSSTPEVAVAKALRGKPQQVILVTGQSLAPDRLAAIRKALDAQPSVRVDVVLIGRDDPDLRALAKAHNGRFTSPAASRLTSWYRQSRDAINTVDEELIATPATNLAAARITAADLAAPPPTTALSPPRRRCRRTSRRQSRR
ncbi:MAG: hypothetical protein NTW19_03460 [Planctomycetota bacterium]|nr:hypothetical protein [Planctomycetota bacterium]